jgi:hypothetical protein
LNAAGLSREHCDRLLSVLSRHEEQAVDSLSEGLRTQYVANRLTLDNIQNKTGEFAPAEIAERFKDILHGQPATIGNVLAQLLGQDGLGGRNPQDYAKTLDAALAKLSANDFAREAKLLNALYSDLLAATELPFVRQQQVFADATDRLFKQEKPLIVSLITPAFAAIGIQSARVRTQRNATRCLVALRRSQLDGRGSGNDLATIVRAAGIPEIPLDVFANAPLKMTQVGGRPVIYSVGTDGQDDRAARDWNYGRQSGDFIFRLTP